MDINQQEIQSIRSILHLVYHRNKNQHQKAKWWKYLSMLKRSVSSLAQTNSKTEITAKASSKRKGKINSNSTQIQHLHTNLIPRCYQAFSTVVADNQFSTLGVVLMAVLARLAKSTGMRYPRAQAQVKKNPNSNTNSNPVATKPISLQSKPNVDLGEKILRDGGEDMHKPEAQLEAQSESGFENAIKKSTLKKQKKSKLKQMASSEPHAEEEADNTKSAEPEEVKSKEKSKIKKSKSKKKKDAIDDLFSGLF